MTGLGSELAAGLSTNTWPCSVAVHQGTLSLSLPAGLATPGTVPVLSLAAKGGRRVQEHLEQEHRAAGGAFSSASTGEAAVSLPAA